MAEPRPVEPNEIEDLAEMIGAIFRIDDHYPRAYMVSQLKRTVARHGALVVCEDGKPVSHIRTVYSTALVMGGSAAPEVSGGLGRVLPRILPVPFPMPGFNYA